MLGIEVDGSEEECVLTDGEKCSYRFDLLSEKIEDNLIDEDVSDAVVSDFLASL